MTNWNQGERMPCKDGTWFLSVGHCWIKVFRKSDVRIGK